MMEKGFRIWEFFFFRKLLSGHFFSVRFVSVRSRARLGDFAPLELHGTRRAPTGRLNKAVCVSARKNVKSEIINY